MTLIKQALDEN